MLPYLLHLLLLTEILLSKSQTVKLFTPDTSFSNTLECISKQVCFFVFLRFVDVEVFIEFVTTLFLLYGLVFWPEACGISASQPGIEPTHPALESEVLTTGPPGKSLQAVLKLFFH